MIKSSALVKKVCKNFKVMVYLMRKDEGYHPKKLKFLTYEQLEGFYLRGTR